MGYGLVNAVSRFVDWLDDVFLPYILFDVETERDGSATAAEPANLPVLPAEPADPKPTVLPPALTGGRWS